MVRKFCYRQRGHDFGPFTADEMRGEAAGGRIESDAIVWEYGTNTGVYAKDVVGLFVSSKVNHVARPDKSQPPPLQKVSDGRIFEYVEFLFFREMKSFDEELRLGVFTRQETAEKHKALLSALRRLSEALGRKADPAYIDRIESFYAHVENRYRDLERVRRCVEEVTVEGARLPLDAALAGALVGAAAALFVPWEPYHPHRADNPPDRDHDTVVKVQADGNALGGDPRSPPGSAEHADDSRGRDDAALHEGTDEVEDCDHGLTQGFKDVSENWD